MKPAIKLIEVPEPLRIEVDQPKHGLCHALATCQCAVVGRSLRLPLKGAALHRHVVGQSTTAGHSTEG